MYNNSNNLKILFNRNYLVSASKDGYLMVHKLDQWYQPFKHVNKYGLTFDLDNTMAFSFNVKFVLI